MVNKCDKTARECTVTPCVAPISRTYISHTVRRIVSPVEVQPFRTISKFVVPLFQFRIVSCSNPFGASHPDCHYLRENYSRIVLTEYITIFFDYGSWAIASRNVPLLLLRTMFRKIYFDLLWLFVSDIQSVNIFGYIWRIEVKTNEKVGRNLYIYDEARRHEETNLNCF